MNTMWKRCTRPIYGFWVAVLLCLFALTAVTTGVTAAESDLCQKLERQLDRCADDPDLSPETQASCDRVEQSFRALCGEIDMIHATASAAGPGLDLLSQDYAIVDIEEHDDATLPFALAHVVIGPAALDHPRIMAWVNRAYRAGLTVAIANATQDEADLFDKLVDGGRGASCLPAEGKSEIALYGLQQRLRQQPPVESRYCLPDLVDVEADTSHSVRQWLRARFASPLQVPVGPASSGSVNLENLAKKIHCSELVVNAKGQIQQDVFLSSLRSFEQQSDFFYVNNVVQFVPRVSEYSFSTSVLRPSAGTGLNDLLGTRLLFTEPSTITEAVSQYTNSRSTTVSGGVGFGSSGLNVEASVSVTVGTETTVTVPPVTILNTSNLATALPIWSFQPASAVPNTLFDVTTSFLWIVDREIYPNGGEGSNELFSFFDASISPNVLSLQGQCDFPLPFPTWEVPPPQITSVEPTSARRGGGTFLIRGEQMYPSIVADVLLGGDALGTANFVTIDDTEIKVVVPSGQRVGLTPVQVNTLFNGQILPSNNDVEVDILP